MGLRAAFWWWPFGRVPELTALELARRLEHEKLQLVDVRTPGEFSKGRIAGALNVPIATLPQRMPDLALDATRPVVAICLSAHRSIPAVRLLRAAGFEAYQLAGGMLAWRRAHLAEERAS